MSLRATGLNQQIPGDVVSGIRMERLIAEAQESKRHLWVLTAGWRINDPTIMQRSAEVIMDVETLIVFAGPGCYVCEREWHRGMELELCPGDPLEGRGA